jgi:hypothetical protein
MRAMRIAVETLCMSDERQYFRRFQRHKINPAPYGDLSFQMLAFKHF